MSSFAFLRTADGQLLKVQVSDDGVLQSTVNGSDFADMPAGATTVTTDATLSGDGTEDDPLTVESAPLADVATVANGVAAGSISNAALGAGVPHGWTRVDIAVAVQDLSINWVGNTGTALELVSFVVGGQASGDCNYTFQPNGVSTNQASQFNGGTGSTSNANVTTDLMFGYTPETSGWCSTRILFYGKTGTRRLHFGTYHYETAANGSPFQATFTGRWTDSATAVTTVNIHGSVAAGIGVGSWFLYRTVPVAS